MLNEHIAFKVMEALQKETLNLYALVDGLEYDRLFQKEITQDETSLPLFIQPNNQDIAFAGPWLFNIIFNTNSLQNQIIQLEQNYPSVTWIISHLSFKSLFSHLEDQLHIRLEDNRNALLRYYDPRVLHKLPTVITQAQFNIFTLEIDEWIYFHENNYYSLMTGRLS